MNIHDFDQRLASFVAYFAVELNLPVEVMWGAVVCRATDQFKAMRSEREKAAQHERAGRPEQHPGSPDEDGGGG